MVLQVSHLTGFGSGGGGPFTLTYQSSSTATVSSPTATYTSAGIGTAVADRIVFAGFTSDASTNGDTFTCTIGGISATQVAFAEGPSGIEIYCALFAATVPTGTTATIVVTSSATMTTLTRIHVWTATGLQTSTPTSTAQDDGIVAGEVVTADASINSQYNATVGLVVGAASATFTWSGLTESSDLAVGTSAHSVATITDSSTGTLSISATPTGGRCTLLIASFSQ